MKTFILTTFVTLAVLSQNMAGQFSAQSTISSMYDDNVNNNALQLKSNVSILNFNGGYSWEGEGYMANMFYDGTFSYFESLLERTNHFHSVNGEYTLLYGADDENALNAGGMIAASMNRDTYVIFDHSLFSAFISSKYVVTDWMITKAGYTMRTLSFSSLSDFSYTEHALYGHAAFAVTPSTTAIFQTDIGSKFYSSTPMTGSSSMRKGVISLLMPSVTQLIGMVKLGQRITDEIGFSIIERYQWNIQKQTRYLSSQYGFISDDELFDDHYGYEGFQTSATITSILSETMTMKLSGGVQNKLYSSLSAYDANGNIVADQRIDTRTYVNIGLQKNFDDLGISLKGAMDVIQNSSNDSFYRYTNNAFTLELGIPF